MSELISGKEALIAWHDGLEIEVKHSSTGWFVFNDHNFGITVFKSEDHQFRLKPRTVNLNGVEVGELKTAMWCRNYPKEVNLEFKTEDDAHHFYANAMKIFNGV